MTPSIPERGSRDWVCNVLTRVLARDVETIPPITDPRNWSDVLAVVRHHRLVSVFAPTLSDVNLPESIATELRSLQLQSVQGALGTARDTATVSSHLSAAGIDHLIVKGIPLAGLTTRDLTARGPGDVDLWVRPSDVAEAEAVLLSAGWQRRSDAQGLPRPNDGARWRWFIREQHEFPMARAGRSDLDVHWRLCEDDRELSFDFAAALARAELVTIGGVDVPTLSPTHALEHCAQHARKESWPTLRHVVDIVRLARLLGDEEVRRLASEQRNVRRAIGVAAHVDPSLASLISLSASDTRLSEEAWTRCITASSWVVTRRSTSGWAGARGWLDHASWLWRTAPTWHTRLSQATRVLLRMRVLADPRRRPWRDRSRGLPE